ncbi:MAG: asparagine synthase (glutamine-hydrolyzing) [Rhodospirillales bacterium]|nr:asparagine synthase (glutamine-hydrolyzing) [Rhodospirillales bacterium]|tara:strand:- start:567 stop:2393 length:1827 start_codon:yes stop_codon:yes gene_type:complete
MCGISGIIGNTWHLSQLDGMVTCQTHRGPDFNNIFTNESQYVGLGHNRLSIIDLSPEANCPMQDNTGNLTIVFNGEIYNYLDLKSDLRTYNFKSNSDTEVILAAYTRWGTECTKKLIGMFAFAIWDEYKQQLFCARDRLGIKPFYYYHLDGKLIFGSEIKSILTAGIEPQPNWEAWGDYLNYGYMDHNDETFFKHIYSLAPGSHLLFSKGDINTKKYWDLPRITNQFEEDPYNHTLDYISSLLEEIILDHLQSDVPMSVNLSGGLDSSLLACILDKRLDSTVPMNSFTSSFKNKQYDEYLAVKDLKFNNLNTKSHVTNHESIPELAEELIWYEEAPFGGVPTLAYFDLHKNIRQNGCIVSLEGQGLDELFAGYEYTLNYYYADIINQHGWKHLESLIENNQTIKSRVPAIKKIMANQSLNISHDGTQHLHHKSLSPDLLALSSSPPSFETPFDDHLRNILYRDLRYTKLPRVLRMNDRLSMANGIELRVPFLDHRLVEFAFKLPNNLKIKNDQGKSILREYAETISGISWTSRPKKSIVTPQTPWLQNELQEWVLDTISSKSFQERGLFDTDAVSDAYQVFRKGNPKNSFYVWQWINTELWFKTFISK